jgi:hypothetical protein
MTNDSVDVASLELLGHTIYHTQIHHPIPPPSLLHQPLFAYIIFDWGLRQLPRVRRTGTIMSSPFMVHFSLSG